MLLVEGGFPLSEDKPKLNRVSGNDGTMAVAGTSLTFHRVGTTPIPVWRLCSSYALSPRPPTGFHYIDQAGLKLTEILQMPLLPSAGIKGMYSHTKLVFFFLLSEKP